MKRFRAVITMLGVYLQEHHLVASGEKHFDPRDKSQLDPRNELTLEYSEFLWKIGRLNTAHHTSHQTYNTAHHTPHPPYLQQKL